MIQNLKFLLFFLATAFMVSCADDDVPPAGNEEELITKVELLFSPKAGGAPIVITALDPDGEGPEHLRATGAIMLEGGVTYELFVSFENTLNGEDITEEVEEEGDEHMIFFGFTDDVFESPSGTGNIDSRSGSVNYLDKDENGLNIGLITSWIAVSRVNPVPLGWC